MGMGIPVTAFGICIELTFDPPLWVHAVTTLPMILILCILPLRFLNRRAPVSTSTRRKRRVTIEPKRLA